MILKASLGLRILVVPPPIARVVPAERISKSKYEASKTVMKKIIDILITIDTDGVKREYSKPSQDPKNPTGISHKFGYMVASGTPFPPGQSSADLDINALVGDTVRVFATSGSDNFEDAVLLYRMRRFRGDRVFGLFKHQCFTRPNVVPDSGTSMLPAQIVNEKSWFLQARVIAMGATGYTVWFALYSRDLDTGQPVLFGYYAWNPNITTVGAGRQGAREFE